MTMYVLSACFWGVLLRWFWPNLGLLKWIFSAVLIAAAQWAPSFMTFCALKKDINRLTIAQYTGGKKENTDDN